MEGSARLGYGDTDCFNNCHSFIIINSPRIIIILKRGIHMMYIVHISLSCIQLSYMHPQSLSYHICIHSHIYSTSTITQLSCIHSHSIKYIIIIYIIKFPPIKNITLYCHPYLHEVVFDPLSSCTHIALGIFIYNNLL